MKNYTTIEKIEAYTLLDIDVGFRDQVEEWIEQIEAYIDKFTGRSFGSEEPESGESETDIVTRLYDGNNERELFIDDCLEVTKISTIDTEGIETEIESGYYYLYPANRTPKNKIRLVEAVFVKGNQNIKVEGRWGYSEEVPKDIQLAATILVTGIMNYSADADVKSETIGSYSVTYGTEEDWQKFKNAMGILNSHRKMSFI